MNTSWVPPQRPRLWGPSDQGILDQVRPVGRQGGPGILEGLVLHAPAPDGTDPRAVGAHDHPGGPWRGMEPMERINVRSRCVGTFLLS